MMKSKSLIVSAVICLSTSPSLALNLRCELTSDPIEADRMGSVNRFTIDESGSEVRMYSRYSPSEPEWTFRSTKQGDIFDPKGDSFLVRKDDTGIYGAGVRAGFPHSFYYNSDTKNLTWTY